jgi:predicted PurR-regulated permease PerM
MKWSQWISLIALAIALYILWQIRQVLLLAFTAVVLATVLNRAVRQFQSFGIKRRSFAVLFTAVVFLLILTAFTLLIVPPFVEQFQQLTTKVPQGIERFSNWLYELQARLSNPLLNNLFGSLERLAQMPQSLRNQLFENFFAFFSSTFNIVLSTLLIFILTLMFLVSPLQYRLAFTTLFPASFRRRVDEILTKCEEAMGGWLVGILVNMSVITVFSFIGLLILGVPLALANGLLAGLLTFIPNVGPVVSIIPPMAIALLDAPWKALAVLILYIAIQQIETNILTPIVMQKQVSLLPAVTLLSQLVFAFFFDFLGLLMALPLTIIVQVWVQEFLIKEVLDKN